MYAEIVDKLERHFDLQVSPGAARIFNKKGDEVGVLQVWKQEYYFSFGSTILLKATRCNIETCIQAMLRPTVHLEDAYKRIQACLAGADENFCILHKRGVLPPEGVQVRFSNAELELWVRDDYRCYTSMDQSTLDEILRRVRACFFFEDVPQGKKRRDSDRTTMEDTKMERTTLKLSTFVSTPLRDASLSSIPGVGAVTLTKLETVNITKAEQLMGEFMILSASVEKMASWLQDVCDVRVVESKKIAEALRTKYERLCTL